MNNSRCPHCGIKLGNYLYADTCPSCLTELEHNTRPLSDPTQISQKRTNWLFTLFTRLVRLVES